MSCEEEAIFITAFEYMAYIREDLWEISANVNKLFGPFATYSLNNSICEAYLKYALEVIRTTKYSNEVLNRTLPENI